MSLVTNTNESHLPSAAGVATSALPRPDWTLGAMDTPLPAGVVMTRASNATYTNGRGALVTASNNIPRMDFDPDTLLPRGLLIEESRTNYLLNSMTPATQTVSLNTGTYTLWLEGSGSCTCAAGTAVGTGFGAATAASWRTFTVTTAGTVTFTNSGTVTRFQCENGTYPTSLIVTVGASATRAADMCTAALGSWYSGSAGTFVMEFSKRVLDATHNYGPLYITDGTANNVITVYVESSNNSILYSVTTGGVTQASLGMSNFTAQKPLKIAGAYALNDVRGAYANTLTPLDNSATMPTVTTLQLGNRYDGLRALNGWIRSFSFYRGRLPDAQLMQLTQSN